MPTIYDFADSVPAELTWFNEPETYEVAQGLHLTTEPGTDFWQRTHYGFRRDNGHALLRPLAGDFALSTAVTAHPRSKYDQCGLLVRGDEGHWIKLAAEYIHPGLSLLGSVVTNGGYSDWATQPADPAAATVWYRINRRGVDYLLESSIDGRSWQQLRIAHLGGDFVTVQAGLYACSPGDGRFSCTFAHLALEDSAWAVG